MESPDAENVIKIQLIKSRYDGFGFDICRSDKCWLGPSYPQITSLWPGGIAERSGLVHLGDVILALNGVSLADRSAEEVRAIFSMVHDDSLATLTLHGAQGYLTYLQTVTEEGCHKAVRINIPLSECQINSSSPIDRSSLRTYTTQQRRLITQPHKQARSATNASSGQSLEGKDSSVENGGLNSNKSARHVPFIVAHQSSAKRQDGDNRTKTDEHKNNRKTTNIANFLLKTIKSHWEADVRKSRSGLCKGVPTPPTIESQSYYEHSFEESELSSPIVDSMCDIGGGTIRLGKSPKRQVPGHNRSDDQLKTTHRQVSLNETQDRNMNGHAHTQLPSQSGDLSTSDVTITMDNHDPGDKTGHNGYQDGNKVIQNGTSDGTDPGVNDRHESPGVLPVGPQCVSKPHPVRYLVNGDVKVDILHTKANVDDTTCTRDRCMGSLMQNAGNTYIARPKDKVRAHAKDFLDQYYQSIKRLNTASHEKRVSEVMAAIDDRGTYDLTTAELTFGAKTAWRNAPRCIGRIQWSKLQVFDARHIRTARGMFEAICNHIKFGTNKGNIRSAITIFPPRTETGHDYRVWNPMMISYAGYTQEDGSVVGDPANVEFTELCQKLGWKGQVGRFDILPLVLQADGMDPEVFIIPDDLILQAKLSHPDYDWFDELGLQWYALPGVSSMELDCGGLEFTAIPFNGWYMGPEIGSRDLCDPNRYNCTRAVAEKMGLDTRTNATLWKDRAVIEINVAVLHSFQKAGITLVDHHTASETFMKHFENEFRLRGGCPGDWVWIVPPISGSLTPVFHQEMLNYKLRPSYEYQEPAWKRHVWKKDDNSQVSRQPGKKHKFKDIARVIMFSSKMMRSALAKRIKCTILYASETGKSERYAKTLCEVFKTAFDAKAFQMNEYDFIELEHESLVLVVTSTFGNGDPPDNGKDFAKELYSMKHPGDDDLMKRSMSFVQQISQEIDASQTEDKPSEKIKCTTMRSTSSEPLANVRFSVFALGSTAYPNFCAFGKYIDCMMSDLGAERVNVLAEGDELCGQEQAFNDWSKKTFKAACEAFCIDDQFSMDKFSASLTKNDNSWSPGKYRLSKVDDQQLDICDALSMVHNKKVQTATLVSRTQLQKLDSERKTILIKVDSGGSALLKFVPGDHLAIFACNRQQIVDVVLSKIASDIDPEQSVKVEIQKEKNTALGAMKYWTEIDRMPFVTSMRTALTRFLDITSPPTPPLLSQFANHASEEDDRQKLHKLATDSRAYDEWRYDKQPTLADLLLEFPSINVAPTLLLSQLPLLQARYYSISSSPDVYPDEIHTTVAVVTYRSRDGEGDLKYGVCSTWLNTIDPGQSIACYVRSEAQFHMPQTPSVPIIMVGPGTGVAPFRGFWQQRSVDKMKFPDCDFGPMCLYFGCRRSDTDDIYRDEKNKMIAASVLDDIPTALSREPGMSKTYVQNMLTTRGQEVCDYIVERKGHLYVCGDVAMAADIRTTLETIIQRFGNMTEAEAKKYVISMREQNLFHEDIFGVTLKTSDVQRKAREKAVQRRWLNVVRAAKIFSKVTAKKN